jgi:N-acetylglucosamine-6-phosphate deacetylase
VGVSNKGVLAIDGRSIFSPTEHFSPGRLIVRDGVIEQVGRTDQIPLPDGAHRIDAANYIVTPGFIDPHIHGCGGVDVMDGTYESLNAISRIIVRHGTTSFLPTTVSSPIDVLDGAVERLGSLLSRTFDGARPLGIHLEGPFISTMKRGTHKASNVVPPNVALFRQWIALSRETIRLVTVAPELEGINAILMSALEAGVTVAMGHSNASFEDAGSAASRGVHYAVHTFNAMRDFTHRDPGIVGAVLSDERIFAEIIADGIHVHPSVVRILARAKGKSRVLLVTDAISATDMPDGEYVLGPDLVQVTGGVCRDNEGRLAGSTLTQEIALKNFVEWSSFPFQDALLALTLNPALALRLEAKGRLVPGADADIAIIDEHFRIMKTFVDGRLVFDRN